MTNTTERPTAADADDRGDGDAESRRSHLPDGKRWVLGGSAPSRGDDRRGNSGP